MVIHNNQYHMNHLHHHNDVILELPDEEYDISDTYDHNHIDDQLRNDRNDDANPVSTLTTTKPYHNNKLSSVTTTTVNKNDTLRSSHRTRNIKNDTWRSSSSSSSPTTSAVEKKNNKKKINDDMTDTNNNNNITILSSSKTLSSQSKEKQQQRRNSNTNNGDTIKKDYEKTGQWGNHVSKKEMIIMIGMIIMILLISITAVLLYVLVFQTNTTNNSNNNSTNTNNGTSSSFAKNATTNTVGTVNTNMNSNSSGSNSDHKSSSSSSLYGMDIQDDYYNTKLIFDSNEDMYQAILLMIQNSNIMTKETALSLLPTSVYDIPKSLIYDDLSILGSINNNPSINNSWIWTISYLLYGDIRPKYITELKQRFVLTFLFIETVGTSWYMWTNWLSPLHICQWYGITCQSKNIDDIIQYIYESSTADIAIDNIPSNMITNWNITTDSNSNQNVLKEDMIIELDLANNNLNGTLSTIPLDLLYNSLESIFLLNNTLRGTIPGETFSSLSHLSFLYLQNNILTGTIPESLRPMNSTSLGTIHIYLYETNFIRVIVIMFYRISHSHLPSFYPFCQSYTYMSFRFIGTLFVQGNQFNGTWPASFCPAISTECGDGDNETTVITNANECITGLKEFGLNCIETPCPENCCTNFNCFN